jgi:hypothetical protein
MYDVSIVKSRQYWPRVICIRLIIKQLASNNFAIDKRVKAVSIKRSIVNVHLSFMISQSFGSKLAKIN